MTPAQWLYLVLADAILLVHFAFVAFVVVGLLLVWIGKLCGWTFVRNIWFRIAHLAAIGVVAAESVLGFVCPLTTWENRLRVMAGSHGQYQGSFIQHWLHQVMFFDVRDSVLMMIYIVFFTAVALSFWLVPPRRRTRRITGTKPSEIPT